MKNDKIPIEVEPKSNWEYRSYTDKERIITRNQIVMALKELGCSLLEMTCIKPLIYPMSLKKIDYSIQHYHLLCGYRERNFLLFIKPVKVYVRTDLCKPQPNPLTPLEREFIEKWPGTVHVVSNVADAIRIVTEEKT